MKWREVKKGQRVRVKGEVWEVAEREGDSLTLVHPALGKKTGSPPPEGEVVLIPVPETRAPEPNARPADRTLFRPKSERPRDERMERIVEKERRAEENRKRVAADNEVSQEAVEALGVKISLGATLIGVFRPKQTPEVSEVRVMDPQTLKNHLHFFHDTYPETDDLEELKTIHEGAESREKHEHSVPF